MQWTELYGGKLTLRHCDFSYCPLKPVLASGIGRQSSGVGSPDLCSRCEGKSVPVHVTKACRGS